MKERIKTVRESKGLSLTKFAESLNSSVSAISRYESGDRIPSDAILKLISKEYNISYAWLKTGIGPMEEPLPDENTLNKITETYQSLPIRLRCLVDALINMTPDWYSILDEALEEIERRKIIGDIE